MRVNSALTALLLLLVACGSDDPEPVAPVPDEGGPTADEDVVEDVPDVVEDVAPVDVVDDVQQPDVPEIEEDAGPDVTIEDTGPPPTTLPPPVADGYTPGGVLAWYHDGKAMDPDVLLGDNFLFRLEPALDLTLQTTGFPALNDGKQFTARYVGAVQVTEAGVYRIAGTANDGMRLRLGGVTVLEFWDVGELFTADTLVQLEVGWYPLELVYARLNWNAHVQLWMGGVDGLLLPLGPDALGYESELPEGAPELTGELVTAQAGIYQAKLDVTSSAPAELTVTVATEGKDDEVIAFDKFAVEHEVVVTLAPDSTWTMTAALEDLWGRKATLEPVVVETGTIPSYTPGAILGEYFQGGDYKAFETKVATRLDPVINHPASLDGNNAGSFLLPMGGDKFAVKWTGGLLVDKADEYVLYIGTDDGQRMYLDGIEVVDQWTDHGLSYVPVFTTLAAGWHTLEVHMYENGGAAAANLEWESETLPRQVIPSENLGFVLPAGNDLTPEVVNLTGSNEAPGQIKVELWASELCTGTLEVTTAGETQTVELLGPADAFQWWGDGFAPGDVVVKALLTDAQGDAAAPMSVTVTVPAP